MISVPLLKVHHGTGPDLILFWNAMATRPQSVDVIVHLHGYSTCQRDKHIHLSRDTVPRSALAWSDPEGIDPTPARTRPTLGLLPRGRLFGGKTGRGYNFPALTTKTGLRELVKFGLERLAQRLGVPNLSLGRLILTAHSGGGAPLLKILQHIDPHEIHVFDGLYQSPNALIRWVKKRITQDSNAAEHSWPSAT